MKKKQTVKDLKKKADQKFSQYIRLRDADKYGMVSCITCPVRKPWKEMQNGHFVSRSVNALRYDEENCNAQCTGCNMFKQGNQYEYSLNLDKKYGDGTAERLYARRFETKKFTIPELEQIIEAAKEYVDENNH